MKGIPQGRHTREFRQEAVKLVVEERISCREAAQKLSLAPSTLAYWVKAYKAGKLGEIGKMQKPLTEIEMVRLVILEDTTSDAGSYLKVV